LIFNLITQFYRTAAGKPITTAAVIAYHPFGDSLRFNPHFHALILEGGFDFTGQFYHLPIHDTARLAECLRQRTIGLFLKLSLITQPFAENLLCWRHSGFSVDNSVRRDGGDHKALAQCIARAPLSLQKLTYDRLGGRILYYTDYNPYFKRTSRPGTRRTSSPLSRSSFLPGAYATCTTMACTHHDATLVGHTCPMSHDSPQRPGKTPTP